MTMAGSVLFASAAFVGIYSCWAFDVTKVASNMGGRAVAHLPRSGSMEDIVDEVPEAGKIDAREDPPVMESACRDESQEPPEVIPRDDCEDEETNSIVPI